MWAPIPAPATPASSAVPSEAPGRRRTRPSHFVAEVVTCSGPPGPSTTVEEYLDRWLDHITPIRSPTTVRGYRFKVRRITAKIGKVQLDQLTAQHLDRIYRQWLDEGLDPSSVHHLHRVLSAALHQAVKRGLVSTAVTDQASPPPRRPPPRELPTPQAIHRLISEAEGRGQPVLAAAIAIATTTGLRRGELAGLQWSDLDPERGRLYVRRAIKNDVHGGWVAGPPKTHQARAIALDVFTLAVLREHRVRADSSAQDAGITIEPNGYILTFDPSGVEPIRPDSGSGVRAAVPAARPRGTHAALVTTLQCQHPDGVRAGCAHHRRAARSC